METDGIFNLMSASGASCVSSCPESILFPPFFRFLNRLCESVSSLPLIFLPLSTVHCHIYSFTTNRVNVSSISSSPTSIVERCLNFQEQYVDSAISLHSLSLTVCSVWFAL